MQAKLNYESFDRLINTPQYRLKIVAYKNRWIIKGILFDVPDNTKYFPQTVSILSRQLPSILRCTCFNPENLPFSEELRHTEIGHLLEHIILEYLCEEKICHGSQSATFRGETTWFKTEPSNFEITIDKEAGDNIYLIKALSRSLSLFNEILQSNLTPDITESLDAFIDSSTDYAYLPVPALST
jgi:hypothetical protein